jgi:hypothetical protein
MMQAPSARKVLAAQGAYYVATGVAPFVSRRAFEVVTGPKLEWWLVQTVGALVTAAGGALLRLLSRNGSCGPPKCSIKACSTLRASCR